MEMHLYVDYVVQFNLRKFYSLAILLNFPQLLNKNRPKAKKNVLLSVFAVRIGVIIIFYFCMSLLSASKNLIRRNEIKKNVANIIFDGVCRNKSRFMS